MILDRLDFIERLREEGYVFGELNLTDGTYYDAIALDDINKVLDDIIANGDTIVIENQKE